MHVEGFCSADNQGESAGLCVTPDLADKMEDMNPGISCGDDKKEFTSLRMTHPMKKRSAKDAVRCQLVFFQGDVCRCQ